MNRKPFSPYKEHVSIERPDDSFKPGGSYFYYIQIVQSDGEKASSGPVWVD